MMLPNQITSQQFSASGKGGFKSVEVTAFLQRVYQSYSKLYNDNKILNDKLAELMPQMEEYNRNKNTIADALIWAKSTAEKNIEEAKAIAENLVSEATAKSEKLLEDTKAEADAYYADKTVSANKNLERAKAELESLKQQSEVFSERYISEINVKTHTIIEDANSKAASIVAEAYSEAKKTREKADKIIADANAELAALKNEAANIKNQILALVSYAEKAASAIDDSVFAAVEKETSDEPEIIEAKQIDADAIEKFSFEGVQTVNADIEDESTNEDSLQQETPPAQPEYVRFFGADMPDINDFISGIFSAASETQNASNEEENSFKFEKVVSDFDKPSERKPFDFLKKDSDGSVEF